MEQEWICLCLSRDFSQKRALHGRLKVVMSLPIGNGHIKPVETSSLEIVVNRNANTFSKDSGKEHEA